jgi:hypothetical protein
MQPHIDGAKVIGRESKYHYGERRGTYTMMMVQAWKGD